MENKLEISKSKDWEKTECIICGNKYGNILFKIEYPHAPKGFSAILECSNCKLKRLLNRPSQADIGEYYSDNYNAFSGRNRGHIKQEIWDLLRDIGSGAQGRGRKLCFLRFVVEPLSRWAFDIHINLAKQKSPKVIESGCGFGDLLYYLKKKGCSVYGVDLDSRACQKGSQLDINIHCGSLESASFSKEDFDLGILCHSLEHVPDPRSELLEMNRILKPGSELHIAVPNGNSVGLELDGMDWAHLSHPLHFWYFDLRNLRRLLKECGFGVVKNWQTTSRHHYFKRAIKELSVKGPLKALRRFARQEYFEIIRPESGDVLRVIAIKDRH